ncbi:MAG: YkgJ family cysteine cluster protein [Burkholderiaceae bacterium]|nr:YkgJ family cysteine cluster protein [Burkholderiaceae bacterium]
MNCRPDCGACCTAPSISSAIPGMPAGKPAGVRCVQLDAAQRCRIFGQAGRPAVCGQLQASQEMCGANAHEAQIWLTQLDVATTPFS